MNGTQRTLSRTVGAALTAGLILTPAAAHADAPGPSAAGHLYPLRPPPALAGDARSEVQDLLGQISDLDDNWESLSQAQRQQKFKGLQDQVTIVQRDAQSLPPGQQLEVEGMLMSAIMRLLDIGRKMRDSG